MNIENLRIIGQHDDNTLKQAERCKTFGLFNGKVIDGAQHFVLSADGHYGFCHPVGGVAAYEDYISLAGVGPDAACGNLAIKTDCPGSYLRENIDTILDDIEANISFGLGRKNSHTVEHELFDSEVWWDDFIFDLKVDARASLGTVGGGNHYVDLFTDENDLVWIGNHFGSRGFGFKMAQRFLKAAQAKDGMDEPPALIKATSDLGERYQRCLGLAGQYAYAGRSWVAEFILNDILGAKELDRVHNNHNSMWIEEHFGRKYYVVRKGATPAFPGQRGFVGGSMGDDAVIIEGVEGDSSKLNLYSTVHGAGRVMSRTAAKGKTKFNKKTGETTIISEPKVLKSEVDAWLKEKGVSVRGSDLDEAPQAYRRLSEVLNYHNDSIKILHRLKPVGVVMAGKDIFDPYKD